MNLEKLQHTRKNMQVHIPSNAQGKLDVKGVVGGGNITVVRD